MAKDLLIILINQYNSAISNYNGLYRAR